MTEKKRPQPRPANQDLLPSQAAFKMLSDEILRHKLDDRLAVVRFRIETDPAELLQRLQQSPLRDLLLLPGESLSVSQPNDHYPDLGLVVGETPVTGVSLEHWSWQERKSRIVLNGSESPPYRIIKYPGEFDWMRKIDISVWFSKGWNTTAQVLTLFDASKSAGVIPKVTRAIYAPEYAKTGYEGHNHKSRPFKDEAEAMFFVNLARELFDKRELAYSTVNSSSI